MLAQTLTPLETRTDSRMCGILLVGPDFSPKSTGADLRQNDGGGAPCRTVRQTPSPRCARLREGRLAERTGRDGDRPNRYFTDHPK